MSKHILKLNVITHLAYGMEESNNIEININNNIESKTTGYNSVNKNIIINDIFKENNKKFNFDNVNRILGKENINYEEYKILLDAFGNKDLDNLLKEKILGKIEKDNIVKSQDIENIVKIKDNNDLLKKQIEEDADYINKVFYYKFFYNFSDNVDLYNICLIIHTIRLILERNLSIRYLIIKSFIRMDFNFILGDFKDNTYFCDNLNKILKKYNRKFDINFIKKISQSKLKEKDVNAFFKTFDNFFTLTFNNEYITADYYIPPMFLNNSKKKYNVLDELINVYKNIDEKTLEKTICIMFTTLHEFNHFIFRLIKSIKSGKIEKYPYSTEEIKNDLIENFKNHENFKDYYEDVNFYLNKKLRLKDICEDVDENLIKNYTDYSFICCDKNGNILNDKDKGLVDDFINLKKMNNEILKTRNNSNKYQFFKYLYDKKFFFGNEYVLKYFDLEEKNKNIYNSFLAHFNNFYYKNNVIKIENEEENKYMFNFYMYLLNNNYDFKNEESFKIYIDLHKEDINNYITDNEKENFILEWKNKIKNNYDFFRNLYVNNFFIGENYKLDIEYYDLEPNTEGAYSGFLNYFNNYFKQSKICIGEKDCYIFSFYRFLLCKKYNFYENAFNSLVEEFVNGNKHKIYEEIKENKKLKDFKYFEKNYSFFQYLYDKNFLIIDNYKKNNLDHPILLVDKEFEAEYNNFLAHFNNFYSQNNILNENKNENENENKNMLSFYKFLLFKKHDFDKNNFDSQIDEYISKIDKNIENLKKKDYSILEDAILKINTGECLADVFAFFNLPLIMGKGMRALGYLQRNLFKNSAELYETKDKIE